jgi:solute carrier family 25 phosphate transporter 23/24/25/41
LAYSTRPNHATPTALEARILSDLQHGVALSAAHEAEVEQQLTLQEGLLRGAGEEKEEKKEQQEEQEEEESLVSTAFLISYFLAGGAAGATSRTVVSPLERLKIIM